MHHLEDMRGLNDLLEDVSISSAVPVRPNKSNAALASFDGPVSQVFAKRCSIIGDRYFKAGGKDTMLWSADRALYREASAETELDGATLAYRRTLVNVMLGLALALHDTNRFCSLVIATSNEYVAKGACNWMERIWVPNGWKKADKATAPSDLDVWMVIRKLLMELEMAGVTVRFWHTPAAETKKVHLRSSAWAQAAPSAMSEIIKGLTQARAEIRQMNAQ